MLTSHVVLSVLTLLLGCGGQREQTQREGESKQRIRHTHVWPCNGAHESNWETASIFAEAVGSVMEWL